mgnify:CR=1 FL=1
MGRKAEILVLMIPIFAALFFSAPSLAETSQTTAGIRFYDSNPVPHNQVAGNPSGKQHSILYEPDVKNGHYPKTGSKQDGILFSIIGVELLIILLLFIFLRRKEGDKHDRQT